MSSSERFEKQIVRINKGDCSQHEQAHIGIQYASGISTDTTFGRRPYNLELPDVGQLFVRRADVSFGDLENIQAPSEGCKIPDGASVLGFTKPKAYPEAMQFNKTSLEEGIHLGPSIVLDDQDKQKDATMAHVAISKSSSLTQPSEHEEFMDDSDDDPIEEFEYECSIEELSIQFKDNKSCTPQSQNNESEEPSNGCLYKYKFESFDNLSCKEQLLEGLIMEEISSYSQLAKFFSNTANKTKPTSVLEIIDHGMTKQTHQAKNRDSRHTKKGTLRDGHKVYSTLKVMPYGSHILDARQHFEYDTPQAINTKPEAQLDAAAYLIS